MKKLFKKADIILILFICLLCLAAFLPRFTGNGNLTAVIYESGKVTHRIELDKVGESYNLELTGKPASTLKVEHNGIRYLSASCPDKLCVKAGLLTHRGDTAACLPQKTVIVIEDGSKNENTPDVITY
jgi:hypothetical protein